LVTSPFHLPSPGRIGAVGVKEGNTTAHGAVTEHHDTLVAALDVTEKLDPDVVEAVPDRHVRALIPPAR
jgi:hypothetical protein